MSHNVITRFSDIECAYLVLYSTVSYVGLWSASSDLLLPVQRAFIGGVSEGFSAAPSFVANGISQVGGPIFPRGRELLANPLLNKGAHRRLVGCARARARLDCESLLRAHVHYSTVLWCPDSDGVHWEGARCVRPARTSAPEGGHDRAPGDAGVRQLLPAGALRSPPSPSCARACGAVCSGLSWLRSCADERSRQVHVPHESAEPQRDALLPTCGRPPRGDDGHEHAFEHLSSLLLLYCNGHPTVPTFTQVMRTCSLQCSQGFSQCSQGGGKFPPLEIKKYEISPPRNVKNNSIKLKFYFQYFWITPLGFQFPPLHKILGKSLSAVLMRRGQLRIVLVYTQARCINGLSRVNIHLFVFV